MTVSVSATVVGGRATLRELRQVEPTLYWATVNKMKSEAKPLAKAVDDNFPTDPPMSGFDHNGRTGWRQKKKTTTKVGGRRKRNGEWPLVRIILSDGPRQLFDMAAAGNLDKALRAHGWGRASRAAWRGNESLRRDTVRAVTAALKAGERKCNAQLVRIR